MSEIKPSIKLVKYFSVEYALIIDCINEIYVYEFNGQYWLTNTRNNAGVIILVPKEQVDEIFNNEKEDLLKVLYATETEIKTIKLLK